MWEVRTGDWTEWLSMFLLKFRSKNGKVKKQLTVSCSWKLDYFSPFQAESLSPSLSLALVKVCQEGQKLSTKI